MSLYTTPLQFGYFTALLFSVLMLIRGFREDHLSDKLLGLVLFLLAIEIQDYTFGFAGINYLWEDLNGFPRNISLAFAPSVYLYVRAITNRNFALNKSTLWHYLPYLIYFIFKLSIFLAGQPVVEAFQKSSFHYWMNQVETFGALISYGFYFYMSLRLYKSYRAWVETEFSNVELVSFTWIRDFIYLIIAGESFRIIWNIIDLVKNLPYEQDWWWHLFTVGVIIYVSINGYSSHITPKIEFNQTPRDEEVITSQHEETKAPNADSLALKNRIMQAFTEEKVYLNPNLTLSDLARKLKTNSSLLSAAINQNFEKNFNDFVNEYRVSEFNSLIKDSKYAHLTITAIAYDCGFNSKSTFNRAYKKITGVSPSSNLNTKENEI